MVRLFPVRRVPFYLGTICGQGQIWVSPSSLLPTKAVLQDKSLDEGHSDSVDPRSFAPGSHSPSRVYTSRPPHSSCLLQTFTAEVALKTGGMMPRLSLPLEQLL